VLRLREYRCLDCETVHEHLDDADTRQIACDCGGVAERIISAPTIHTLSTHFRGTGVSYGGDYVDENLCDPRTREPVRITSLNDKKRKLKQFKLYEKGAHKGREQALKRRHSVHMRPSGTAV
jgi:DNA-directed RNA polymerase subunit RPC12/RpoP